MARTEVGSLAVIGALRMTGDELQLNRVLWAICDDPAVARSFCDAVLAHARGGDFTPGSPPADLRSVQHRALVGRTRRHRLRRLVRKGPGYVDLEFVGGGNWHLQIELKLDSGFGQEQLDRYAEHGPLAAIVRDPKSSASPRNRDNWVGTVAWADLRDDLAELPIADPAARADWQRLLIVMSDDGDFSTERPLSEEVQEAHALLDAIKEPLCDEFKAALRAKYPGRGKAFIDDIRVLGTKPSERQWGRIRLGFGSYEWLAGIGIRDLWRKTPHLQVRLFTSRPQRRDRKHFEQLMAGVEALGYRRLSEGELRLDRGEPRLAAAENHKQVVLDLLASVLRELVDAGAYDLDIEYEER